MSTACDIVCEECNVKLWSGQSSRWGLSIYSHVDDEEKQHLARFLSEHHGHKLVVENDHDHGNIDAEYVEYPEHYLDLWLVYERDGTSSGADPRLKDYVRAWSREQAEEKAGEPPNSWNTYRVERVIGHARTEKS